MDGEPFAHRIHHLPRQELEPAALGAIQRILAAQIFIKIFESRRVLLGFRASLRRNRIADENGPALASCCLLALGYNRADQVVALLQCIPNVDYIFQVADFKSIQLPSDLRRV
jgi:hypothetical protein